MAKTIKRKAPSPNAFRWHGRLEDFFPPDKPSAPLMLALMVLLDDTRTLHRQVQRLQAVKSKSDTDARGIEMFTYLRLLSVAVLEGHKKLGALKVDPEFRGVLLNDDERKAAWSEADGKVKKLRKQLEHFRNTLGGHIGRDEMLYVVQNCGSDVIGDVIVGKLQGTYSFPLAHVALVRALNPHAPGEGSDAVTRQRAEAYLDMLSDAHAHLLAMFHLALDAYGELHDWDAVVEPDEVFVAD